MSVLFWKSVLDSNFVANTGEANIYFTAFELESIENCLWLYRDNQIVCCIRGDGGIDKLVRYASRINRLGAENFGAPVFPRPTQSRKLDEAPETGADSSQGGEA
ncbi:hypothetical protein [Vibrio cionasavignyae]|uniref:hypothetical protein n=1 Tax=Vibrio cionasavignyae TaxID=2910252 RepID=UPI003D0D3C8C